MSPSKPEGLRGVRVGLLEARMSTEMSELVRRYGGVPVSAPSVREAPIDCKAVVGAFLEQLERPAARVVVFLTGVGVTTLFQEAARQDREPDLLRALSRATLACRGPKPSTALKRYGLSATVSAGEPYTSAELLDALAPIDLDGAEVTLVHYGERNDPLVSALRARGAILTELCLYEWLLPENLEPLQRFVHSVLEGQLDAVVFTSQIQCRHLLHVAAGMSLEGRLLEALNGTLVVAAIGPTCASVLRQSGIEPRVVPVNPKMVPLVAGLAEYFAQNAS